MSRRAAWRSYLVLAALGLLLGVIVAVLVEQPGYTDAYYYFNAGQRLVQGDGLTDPYLWTYINAPDALPGSSHTYWMPLASLVAAAGMAVGGAHFGAAQVPFVFCFAALVAVGGWAGAAFGMSRRHFWMAGLLVLFAGFFTPFWATTDTFALFGLAGALALASLGQGRQTGDWRWYALAGALSALGHLARADGLLLALVLIVVALWPGRGQCPRGAVVGVIAYLLVMLPWFVRNLDAIGTPLPTGGLQTAWLRGYDELVNYPPGTTLGEFLDWGWDNILRSRWEAFVANLSTFIAVETWIVLGPFVLLGLWQRRRDPRLLGVILYAVGLHAAMTLVFAYPGLRGGLFHSSSALLPFWAALGVIGLDSALDWAAARRGWRAPEARIVFGGALLVLAALLSGGMLLARGPELNDNAVFYRTLGADLPADAVVMINDPPGLYYHAGRGGVVVPNAAPDVIPEIARRYGVTHLLLDANRTAPFDGLYAGTETYPFLSLVQVYAAGTDSERQLYRIERAQNGGS
ncbi:MAG: hypothetical protein GXY36_04800 [Chloroflexi bacterium]|nr:hypothetical protein [Chloroflexota bacterium]